MDDGRMNGGWMMDGRKDGGIDGWKIDGWRMVNLMKTVRTN